MRYCECGKEITNYSKKCRSCIASGARLYNKKRTMDRNEGLKSYQRTTPNKSYQEILEDKRKQDPITYRQVNNQLLWN